MDLYNSGESVRNEFLDNWDNNYKRHQILRGNSFNSDRISNFI